MYKNSLPTLDGYLTNQGKINFSNCDVLFRDVAKYEEEFFRLEQQRFEREKKYGANTRGGGRGGRGGRGGPPQRGGGNFQGRGGSTDIGQANGSSVPVEEKTEQTLLEEAKVDLKHELEKLTETEQAERVEKAVKEQIKRMNNAKNDALVAKYVDVVELGKDGYKTRYYSDKFHVHTPED